MIRVQAIEINAARHCNNRCIACNHFAPLFDRWFLTVASFKRDVSKLREMLHVKTLSFQGGEPLLHPNLSNLIWEAHYSGFCDTVQVLSNGRLVSDFKAEAALEALGRVNGTLRISQYPNLPLETISKAQIFSREFGFKLIVEPVDSFYPVLAKTMHDGSVYHDCPWRRCLTVCEGYFFLCPLTAYFPHLMPSCFNVGTPWHVDGIEIATLTEDKLRDFLNKTHPPLSCSICTGAQGHRIPWREADSRDEFWATLGG